MENKPRRDVPHPLLVLVLVLYPRRIRFRFSAKITQKLLKARRRFFPDNKTYPS